jgi:tRNA-splicing ligase RtcB
MNPQLSVAPAPARASENGAAVFDSETAPADPWALEVLRAGVADADLAGPAAVLPDFHHKGDKEMPSSIAVATQETIRPVYTSASLNCGMALVALDVDRPGTGAITDFFTRVRERYPYPPTYRRDLTVDEVVRCAADGSRYAVERFGVDARELDRVEERGHLDVEPYGGIDRVRRELPWSVAQLSRIRFGTIGPSNHFIELQEVEEVLDPEAAALLGVEQGQVTLQFHGGGGSLPGELGLLFGRRKRYPRPVQAQMAVQKPLYHLGRARSLEEARRRLHLYFSAGCPPVPREGPEGERMALANAMAMNYGFAFRLSAYASIRRFARTALGAREPRLVFDSPHNTIYDEQLDGESAVVHRHNAARAYPASRMQAHPVFGRTGQPLLLPGTNRTSSYLLTAQEGAWRSLYSAPHGAGSTIKDLVKRGVSGRDPDGRHTLRYRYDGSDAESVPQLDDRGVDEALDVLVSQAIARPVARLRPFAVLN